MDTSIIVNGHPADKLPVADRATQYGDGVFTTVRVQDGSLQHWPLHLLRLKKGLQRLAIDFTAWQQLEQCALALVADKQQAVVKVLISRGQGGRGYTPPTESQPNWVISLHPLPVHYANWRLEGVTLNTCNLSLAKQPLLAGIKHLNRLEQVLIKQELVTKGWQDALVCDTDGMLVETSVANLFWRTGRQWYTPSLQFAGVEGVMRQCLMDALTRQGQSVIQVRARPECLFDANLICITNSLMGAVPVKRVEKQCFDVETTKEVLEGFGLD